MLTLSIKTIHQGSWCMSVHGMSINGGMCFISDWGKINTLQTITGGMFMEMFRLLICECLDQTIFY